MICAVNGACAGIAVSLAAFCDVRYAAAGAKFTTASPRLGLPVEYGLPWVLPRIVGLTRSADILLTGRLFTAEEAYSMGFLNGVFPAEGFEAQILQLARDIAESVSPIAAMTAKRQLYGEILSHDVGKAIEDSRVLTDQMLKDPYHREGVAAMKEKRPPRFTGPQ